MIYPLGYSAIARANPTVSTLAGFHREHRNRLATAGAAPINRQDHFKTTLTADEIAPACSRFSASNRKASAVNFLHTDPVSPVSPAPTVKSVESVKMKLRKGQTKGNWLYVCPQTEENEMLSVRLVEVQFVSPAVIEESSAEIPSSLVTEPLAANAGTPVNGVSSQSISTNNLMFNDGQFNPVTELKIAKLKNAIDDTGVLSSAPDPDQFMVRLVGLNQNMSGSLSINLETIDPQGQNASPRSDNATEVPLYFCWDKPADLVNRRLLFYATPPMLLVAHTEDDVYKHGRNLNPPANSPDFDPQSFGVDDRGQANPDPKQPADRTHLAALGSTVRVSAVNWYETQPSLNQPSPSKNTHAVKDVNTSVNSRKTVTVAVYVFTDSGAMSGNDFHPVVAANFQRARDLFAQVGVTLQLAEGFPKKKEPPKDEHGISLGSDVEAHVSGKFGVPTKKGEMLIDACGAKSADISIVYCSRVEENGEANLYGYAYPVLGGSVKYSNWAFVSGESIGNTVIAFGHEIGHLLTNAGHFGTDYPRTPMPQNALIPVGDIRRNNNLMRFGKPSGGPGIGSGCRLEQLQENEINKFPFPAK